MSAAKSAKSLPPDKKIIHQNRRHARRKTDPSDNNKVKIVEEPYRDSAIKNIAPITLDVMAIPELPYTIPRIVKGRKKSLSIAATPKNETKQRWYVEFFYFSPLSERMERIRVTKKLNRLKDPKEKQRHFSNLCEAYKVALESGWNLLDQNANIKLKKEIIGISLKEGFAKFEEYHAAKGTRPKSISTYRSTINVEIIQKVATCFTLKWPLFSA